jgi:Calcineurin-like phosphoesterase
MTVRVAVIGDVGGHREELRRELRRLGASESGRLPDDLVVVQVGDLVHRGPDSDGVISLVNRYLHKQPEQWIQLMGNHEAYYLYAPMFRWTERLRFGSRRTLRRWSHDGLIHAAVAVQTADEEFLITHAGVTEQFWREQLHCAPTAVEAAKQINELARTGSAALYCGGSVLGGGPPNPMVGPIWADRVTELLPGWTGRQLPFSQVHGHTGTHGPCAEPATTYDAEKRHEITRLLGGRFIGVDPGHYAEPQADWSALVVMATEPPRLE